MNIYSPYSVKYGEKKKTDYYVSSQIAEGNSKERMMTCEQEGLN